MIVSGIQKLTLLDYPGKVACTIFTGGCNLRCPFCHNASLALPERERDEIGEDELFTFLKKRVNILDGVAVTGGEPLLHAELPELLKKIKDLGFSIKLDTNGSFPDKLSSVIEAGLVDRVAMDVKASAENYARVCGIPGFDIAPIRQSIELLLSGDIDYEFRTTLVKGLHLADDIHGIGKVISGAREYYLQGFKDSGDLISGGELSAFSADEMRGLLEIAKLYVPSAALRGI